MAGLQGSHQEEEEIQTNGNRWGVNFKKILDDLTLFIAGPGVEVSTVRGVTATKRKKVRSRSGYDGRSLDPKMSTSSGITPGKRKRSTREKSVESGDILGAGGQRVRTVSLGDTDKMELEDDQDSSSSLSSSEWEDVDNRGPDGEADDEQSDWPGHDPGLTDEELDTEISFNNSKLLGRGRVVRAGSRRLKISGNRSPPYGEMMNRFIKDAGMQSLRLTSVTKASDRNMILSLARLYNLSVHVDLGTLTVSKCRPREPCRPACHVTDTCQEFAVPGVPQLKVPVKDSHKKQRKYGPVPGAGEGPSSSVTTRQQHNSQVRNR